MQNLYYENQFGSTYLVYKMSDGEQPDSVSLGMLTRNSIPGFAPVQFSQMDSDKYIKFNVTGKITATQFLSGQVARKSFLKLLRGIDAALISAEEYMLSQDGILVDTDWIFTDVSSGDTVLICLPVVGLNRERTDLCRFFREIVFGAQFDLAENSEYVARIINYLNGSTGFSADGFLKVIDRLIDGEKQPAPEAPAAPRRPEPAPQPRQRIPQPVPAPAPTPAPQPQRQPAQKPAVPTPKPPAAPAEPKEKPMSFIYLMRHYSKENVEKYKTQRSGGTVETAPEPPKKKKKDRGFSIPGEDVPPVRPEPSPKVTVPHAQTAANPPLPPAPAPSQRQVIGASADFGGTVILDSSPSDDSTVIRGAVSTGTSVSPMLVRRKNNERIRITKDNFKIGRDRSYNDYAVTDNRYVGHSHCHIISRSGEYFIVDDNTKNFTYVDGEQIPPSTEVKLTHGQKISLADEDFEFRLY